MPVQRRVRGLETVRDGMAAQTSDEVCGTPDERAGVQIPRRHSNKAGSIRENHTRLREPVHKDRRRRHQDRSDSAGDGGHASERAPHPEQRQNHKLESVFFAAPFFFALFFRSFFFAALSLPFFSLLPSFFFFSLLPSSPLFFSRPPPCFFSAALLLSLLFFFRCPLSSSLTPRCFFRCSLPAFFFAALSPFPFFFAAHLCPSPLSSPPRADPPLDRPPPYLKNHQNSTRRPPERKRTKMGGRRVKKGRNFGRSGSRAPPSSPRPTHTISKFGLTKFGLAKCGQVKLAKSGLAKCDRGQRRSGRGHFGGPFFRLRPILTSG